MPWTPEISSKGEETMEEILKVNHLNVVFDDISGPLTAVYDVNFGLRRGEIPVSYTHLTLPTIA